MNKNKKIIIGILIMALIIIIGIVVAYKLIENSVTNREDFKFNVENISSAPVETINNEKNEQNYSKVIDNIRLELNIPNEWKYEEIMPKENNSDKEDLSLDNYKFGLKIYKDFNTGNATLYVRDTQVGVCGTGLEYEKIKLNNGKEASASYYDGSKIWNDITFGGTDNIVILWNYGLDESDANEVLDFVKTINITENNSDL